MNKEQFETFKSVNKKGKERKLLIKNIDNNIGKCLIEDKITIFNKISTQIGIENIFQEGLGIRILYRKMNMYLLEEINDLVEDMKKKTKLDLDSDIEDE